MLQGACQKLQCVPKNYARKRKAPEYGALVFSGFEEFSIRPIFQALSRCPMPVHGAFKRCTFAKFMEIKMWELACSRKRWVRQNICA